MLLLHKFSAYVKDSGKIYSEIVCKLKFKDLKLDLKLRVLVAKFMTFEQKKQRWREVAEGRFLAGGLPVPMKALPWSVPQVSVQECHWQWELCRHSYRPWMEFIFLVPCEVTEVYLRPDWVRWWDWAQSEVFSGLLSSSPWWALSRAVQTCWRTDLFLCTKKCWPQSGGEDIIQFSAAVQYCCFGISLCCLSLLEYWFPVINFSSPVCFLDVMS